MAGRPGDAALRATVPAEPGKPCSWCDCPLPDPVQVPGGPVLFAGHDEENCPGCDRGAVFVTELYVPLLDLLLRFPVCEEHLGDAEAGMASQFGMVL